MSTTDDALCRHVSGWDNDPTADAINAEIDICHRCPLLDACRQMTADMCEKGLRPHGVVQAGRLWDLLGRPRKKAQKPPKPDACSNGHQYPADCPTDSAGRRICPTCTEMKAARQADEAEKKAAANEWRMTHCKRGHEKQHGKRCQVCNREYSRKWHEELVKRAKDAGHSVSEQRRIETGKKTSATTCKAGHAFTKANTDVDVKGRRICLTCRAMRRERWAA